MGISRWPQCRITRWLLDDSVTWPNVSSQPLPQFVYYTFGLFTFTNHQLFCNIGSCGLQTYATGHQQSIHLYMYETLGKNKELRRSRDIFLRQCPTFHQWERPLFLLSQWEAEVLFRHRWVWLNRRKTLRTISQSFLVSVDLGFFTDHN